MSTGALSSFIPTSRVSAVSVVSGFKLCRWMRNLATGPPIRLAKTRPKVAQAIPISAAPAIPYLSEKMGAHAIEVPWPPMSDTVPPRMPTAGSRPIVDATPTPVRFCSNINITVANSSINKGLPPESRSRKLALMPIVVKK